MAENRYLVLFRGAQPSGDAPSNDRPSPEQMQKMLASYEEWMTRFADRIDDRGTKLKSTGRVISASGVADGPFVEAKEVVGGYMILKAETYEQAVEVIEAGPMSGGGGSFEIRELVAM